MLQLGSAIDDFFLNERNRL